MHVDGNGDIGYIVHWQEGGVRKGDGGMLSWGRVISDAFAYDMLGGGGCGFLMAVYRVREGFVGGGGRLAG